MSLDLYIPCKVDTSKHDEPVHVFLGNDETGAAMTGWRCLYCDMLFHRRKPCTKHMGLVMNIPASCRVIRDRDEARRKAGKKNAEELELLSDALLEIRERERMNQQRAG